MVLRRTSLISIVFVLVALMACEVYAGGISVPGIGTRARSMGGAFRAVADDWSAAYYNPAGLARIEQSQVSGGIDINNYRPSYDPDVSLNGYSFGYPSGERFPDDRALWLPNISGIVVAPFGYPVTASFAAFEVFQENLEWDLYRFDPAYDSVQAKLPNVDFRNDIDIINFQSTIATSFADDRFHVGLGLSLYRGDLYTNRIYHEPNPLDSRYVVRPYEFIVTDASVDVYGFGFGVNVGFLFEVTDAVSVGATYRSKSTIKMDGTSLQRILPPDNNDIQNGIPDGTEPEADTLFSGHTFSTENNIDVDMTVPTEYGFGIAVDASEYVTLAADFAVTMWSEYEDYDLAYTSEVGFTGWPNIDNMLKTLSYPIELDDAIRFSLGIEAQPSDIIKVRGGYSFEQSAIPDEQFTPLWNDTGDRHHVSGGVSYFYGKFEFAMALEYVSMSDRDVDELKDNNDDGIWDNLTGTYTNKAVHGAFSVTLRF